MTSHSEVSNLHIVRGSEVPDGNCLHCVLWPIVSKFINEHESYQGTVQGPMDMAHVIGELVGSGLYNSQRRESLRVVVDAIAKEIRRSAQDLFETMDKHRRG